MQLVWRFGVAKDDHERPVKEFRAVDLYLVSECVSRELCYISLEVEYMQAYVRTTKDSNRGSQWEDDPIQIIVNKQTLSVI